MKSISPFTGRLPNLKNMSRLEKQQRSGVQLSEKLSSLGIMGDPLRGPLKHFVLSEHYRIEGFKGVLNFLPLCQKTLVLQTADITFIHSRIYVTYTFRDTFILLLLYSYIQTKIPNWTETSFFSLTYYNFPTQFRFDVCSCIFLEIKSKTLYNLKIPYIFSSAIWLYKYK